MKGKAFLWDGNKKLAGEITFVSGCLCFLVDDFSKSNLKIKIKLSAITTMDIFLLYGLEKKGLKIRTKNGNEYQFILENPSQLKVAILQNVKSEIDNY